MNARFGFYEMYVRINAIYFSFILFMKPHCVVVFFFNVTFILEKNCFELGWNFDVIFISHMKYLEVLINVWSYIRFMKTVRFPVNCPHGYI